MSDFYNIKDRLNEALLVRKMTPAELSDLTGIQRSSIWRYLKGTNFPREVAVTKMAQALEVSPSWLMGSDGVEPIPIKPSPVDIEKLTKINQARLLAYYQALLDSQEEQL